MSGKSTVLAEANALRALGGLERWFYYMDRHRPNQFSISATLAGRVVPEDLEGAFLKLQARHPLLSAYIHNSSPVDAYFRRSEEQIVPVRVVMRKTNDQWLTEVAKEASIRFDTKTAPLLRAVLINGSKESDLILTIHHSISDGLGLFYILRDLISAMSGATLTQLPLPASIEEVRSEAQVVYPLTSVLPADGAPRTPYRTPEEEFHVQAFALTRIETAAIRALVRKHGVTVHAALTAALALSGRQERREWRESSVQIFSPINIRKPHDIGESVAVAIDAGLVKLPADNTSDLWVVARDAMNQLAYFRKAENEFTISHILGLTTAAPDSTRVLTSALGYDMVLTNPGVIDLELSNGSVRVVSLWGPSVLMGFANEQSVSALTFDSRLFLTHTSTNPIRSLLAGAISMLLQEGAGELRTFQTATSVANQ